MPDDSFASWRQLRSLCNKAFSILTTSPSRVAPGNTYFPLERAHPLNVCNDLVLCAVLLLNIPCSSVFDILTPRPSRSHL